MNDSTKQGWVRFYRKSTDSSVWVNPIIWFVWSWCLLKANHENKQFPFNGSDITINKGSFITGIYSAQKELPTLSVQNIRTAFNYLKSTNRITITSNNKFSLITIVNWNLYQTNNMQANKPLTNEQQTTNKPLTTNKNDKNERIKEEEEKYPLSYLKDLPLEDIKDLTETYEVSESQVKLTAEKIISYCSAKGRRYKNYKAALRSWIMKDYKKRTTSIKL